MNYFPQPQPMQMQPYQMPLYQPPMIQPPVSQVPQYAAQGVPWVDSIEEVRNCVTPFGQKTMFMSRTEPKFFIRDVDKNGVAYVSEYDFTPHQAQTEAPTAEYITRDEMMQELEKVKEHYESLIQPPTPATIADISEPVYDEPAVPRHAATAAPAAGATYTTNQPNLAIRQ